LERAVKELGMLGVILNDFQEAENGTKMLWYDQPEYDVFWAKVEELDGITLSSRIFNTSSLLYPPQRSY
jgi:hypothetical protein